ncbi:MAG TPA: DUF4251 domain-containing protein [Chitinophagaceae bacterium]|jgi:hypothetical protein|nr:DUF4251 domain-containing protein [Chitinophagaceae bacterium]
MKRKIAFKTLVLFSGILFTRPSIIFSQSDAAVKNWIDSGQYVFVAQQAIPMYGRTIFLTSEYHLIVSADSLIAYLPYYGKAYRAPLDPSEGGIKFVSLKFDHSVSKARKNGWDITMTTKDLSDNYRLSLEISSGGRGTLQVNNTFRQPITFIGYLKEKPKPNKAF